MPDYIKRAHTVPQWNFLARQSGTLASVWYTVKPQKLEATKDSSFSFYYVPKTTYLSCPATGKEPRDWSFKCFGLPGLSSDEKHSLSP